MMHARSGMAAGGSGNATGACGHGSLKFDILQMHVSPVLVVVFLLAFCGNALALHRFVFRERTWHTGIIYSFHLAVSNLLYSLTLPFLAMYYYPPKHWRYGEAVCKIERFLFHCNLYGGIFFITCISLNRYVAIVHPFLAHGRLEPRHANILSGAVWLLVAVISAPVLKFSTLTVTQLENYNKTECLGSTTRTLLPSYMPYSIFLAVFGCGLPFLLTAFSYSAIFRTVYRNPNITQLEKRKVGRMTGTVVALYAVSYLPYHVLRNLNLAQRMKPTDQENCYVSWLIHSSFQVVKILVHFNICLLPLLYAALADSMRGRCCAGKGARQEDEAAAEKVELRG
uniref:Purinergic receptor P2Y11 n=1 Tax=Sphenodon punctatus TaxID=8508 RepID=A0A8D0H0U5_SPHPU